MVSSVVILLLFFSFISQLFSYRFGPSLGIHFIPFFREIFRYKGLNSISGDGQRFGIRSVE